MNICDDIWDVSSAICWCIVSRTLCEVFPEVNVDAMWSDVGFISHIWSTMVNSLEKSSLLMVSMLRTFSGSRWNHKIKKKNFYLFLSRPNFAFHTNIGMVSFLPVTQSLSHPVSHPVTQPKVFVFVAFHYHQRWILNVL